MKDIVITPYSKNLKNEWNTFLEYSKNSPFFFNRSFIEYHKLRFCDYSALVYAGDRLVAVIPATIDKAKNAVNSHGGLTFGGFVVHQEMTTMLFLECFSSYLDFLKENKIQKLLYKAIPYFYHQYPSAEEYYAAFKFGGKLVRRDVGSILNLRSKIMFSSLRKRMIKKACSLEVEVKEVDSLSDYWNLLTEVLVSRHDVLPVHSLDEIEKLQYLFPQNIRLFGAYLGKRMLAGVLIFESKVVAHAQYIASSDAGRSCGALDLIFERLINNFYRHKNYFSFGISTEQNGAYLNEGLIAQKEGFGARATVLDHYEFDL